MLQRLYFLFVTGIFYSVKGQDVKTWRRDTNFVNPQSWESGLLPCENDRVIFPATRPVAVLMPEKILAAEMVLPLNGELIFPENAHFTLTRGQQSGSCPGQDVNFNPTVDFWYDPFNWNITSQGAFPRIPSRKNKAVPHSFQVPCKIDTVHFPQGSSFRAYIDFPYTTTVASLQINNIDYNQEDLVALQNSHIGKMLFPDNPKIEIKPFDCTDETGCACENDSPSLLPTICTFEVPCPSLECSDPITPVGHCCPVCAAQIMFKYKSNFKMERLLQLHQSHLEKEEFHTVESFTAKTYDGKIQTVLIDVTEKKGLANKAAQSIYDAVTADMQGSESYRIQSANLKTSQQWGPGVPIFDQRVGSGLSSGGVVAIVIVIIAGLGLAAAFYIHKRR
ncbi:Protein amnionless, partial [Stegodyphus mimosarum]